MVGWFTGSVRLSKPTYRSHLNPAVQEVRNDDERTIFSRRDGNRSITAVVLVAESEAREISRTLSVSASAEERERRRNREIERTQGRRETNRENQPSRFTVRNWAGWVVWSATVTSAVYATARRDSWPLGVYGRRASVARARIASAVVGPPRARQPRRTFVRVEAERGGGIGGVGGWGFSRRLPVLTAVTYLLILDLSR